MATNKIVETYNQILSSIVVKISPKSFDVDSSSASQIISATDFADLPKLLEYAKRVQPQTEDLLALKNCKTKAELYEARERINVRYITVAEVTRLVNAELERRNKPIANKKRA